MHNRNTSPINDIIDIIYLAQNRRKIGNLAFFNLGKTESFGDKGIVIIEFTHLQEENDTPGEKPSLILKITTTPVKLAISIHTGRLFKNKESRDFGDMQLFEDLGIHENLTEAVADYILSVYYDKIVPVMTIKQSNI